MKYIAHRINTRQQLLTVPVEYGVEIDLRDRADRLILQHDPFRDGEDFEDYLLGYHHGTMILNIKSERIEESCLELLKKYNIVDYFFLDSSFPMIQKLTAGGEKKVALRFSELEGLDTILNMAGLASWVWVDCFSKLPINPEINIQLKKAGFSLCLVSPELQGRPEDIPVYREKLHDMNIEFDAICTKSDNIKIWEAN